MNKLIIFIIAAVVIFSCSSKKNITKTDNDKIKVEVEKDSTEYDIITFNGEFDSWYERQKSPAQYRSEEYYESWNKQYVSAWNEKALHSSGSTFFEPITGYDPATDYGFELNHKLFYYFQYVENVLKIKILDYSPKVVLH